MIRLLHRHEGRVLVIEPIPRRVIVQLSSSGAIGRPARRARWRVLLIAFGLRLEAAG